MIWEAIMQTEKMRTLPIQTRYDESTFIGSGLLRQTLNLMMRQPRNLEQKVLQHSSVTDPATDRVYRWAHWTDKVGEELATIFENIITQLDAVVHAPGLQIHDNRLRLFQQ